MLHPVKEDSDARRRTTYTLKTDVNSSVFKSFLKVPSEAAQRVLKVSLFQVSGGECLNAPEAAVICIKS